MSNYLTQAINLRSYNLSESDKIIVMYSRDKGIIRCVAKGVKKPASKLGGKMQTLVANKLLIATGKNLDIVCQAELIDNFTKLKIDLSKLTYGVYLAELINTFGLEDDSNSSIIYDIFFEALKNISFSSNENEILWTTIRFKLKLMEQLGYAVELNKCAKCNDDIENVLFFSSESGGVVCKKCRTQLYKVFDLDYNIIKILEDTLKFDFPETIESNGKKGLKLDYCFNILKEYISIRSHKKLKAPELIECLC